MGSEAKLMGISLRILLVMLVTLPAYSLAAAPSPAAKPAATPVVKVVKIGVVFPLSGPFADAGKTTKRVYDLAQKQLNAGGGFKSLGGAKLEFVYTDAQSQPDVARAAAERLALQSDISALIGALYSHLTLALGEVADRHKIPQMVDVAFEDSITEQGRKYIFRPGTRASEWGQTALSYAVKEYKPNTVALVYADTSGYQTVIKAIKAAAPATGVKIVLEEPYPPNTTDFAPLAQKIARVAPDVVIAGTYDPDAIRLNRALAEQGVRLKGFVGTGGGHTAEGFIKALGKQAEGVASSAAWHYDDNSAQSQRFVKAFESEYGAKPDQMAGLAYNGVQVLFNAIERAGSPDREKITEALRKTDVETIFGNVKFDRKGQGIIRGAVVIQIQGGKFVTIWPQSKARAKPLPFQTP